LNNENDELYSIEQNLKEKFYFLNLEFIQDNFGKEITEINSKRR